MDLKSQIAEQEKKLAELKKLYTAEEQFDALAKKLGFETHAKYIALTVPVEETPAAKPRKPKTPLNEAQKDEMKALLTAGQHTGDEIADKFNVTPGTVAQWKKKWKLTKKDKAAAAAQ